MGVGGKGYVQQKWSENYLTLLENEKKKSAIVKSYYSPGTCYWQRWDSRASFSHTQGKAGVRETLDKLRHPPGRPYADGWPQLKADLTHLWGFPLGRDLPCSHQWTSIHKACGEIWDPEEWGREGESLENQRVKYSSEIAYSLNLLS